MFRIQKPWRWDSVDFSYARIDVLIANCEVVWCTASFKFLNTKSFELIDVICTDAWVFGSNDFDAVHMTLCSWLVACEIVLWVLYLAWIWQFISTGSWYDSIVFTKTFCLYTKSLQIYTHALSAGGQYTDRLNCTIIQILTRPRRIIAQRRAYAWISGLSFESGWATNFLSHWFVKWLCLVLSRSKLTTNWFIIESFNIRAEILQTLRSRSSFECGIRSLIMTWAWAYFTLFFRFRFIIIILYRSSDIFGFILSIDTLSRNKWLHGLVVFVWLSIRARSDWNLSKIACPKFRSWTSAVEPIYCTFWRLFYLFLI